MARISVRTCVGVVSDAFYNVFPLLFLSVTEEPKLVCTHTVSARGREKLQVHFPLKQGRERPSHLSEWLLLDSFSRDGRANTDIKQLSDRWHATGHLQLCIKPGA